MNLKEEATAKAELSFIELFENMLGCQETPLKVFAHTLRLTMLIAYRSLGEQFNAQTYLSFLKELSVQATMDGHMTFFRTGKRADVLAKMFTVSSSMGFICIREPGNVEGIILDDPTEFDKDKEGDSPDEKALAEAERIIGKEYDKYISLFCNAESGVSVTAFLAGAGRKTDSARFLTFPIHE